MTAQVVSLFEALPDDGQQFILFWYRYPKKVAKREAQRAWARLSSQDRAECLARLPAMVAHWQLSGTLRRYIPHPSTFLNGRRWEDELDGLDEPLTDLGRCEWNKNGNRDPGKGQCEAPAQHSHPTYGTVYCAAHASVIGIGRRA